MGEERGACHDDHGTAHNPRDGRQQGARADAAQVGCPAQEGRALAQAGGGVDEQAALQVKIERFVGELSPQERDLLFEGEADPDLTVGFVSSWSGLLPRPEDFLGYPEEVRESIVAWNNAMIIDESARSDRLTDAVISQSRAELYLNFAVNVVFALASLVAFVLTGKVQSFGFLAIPAVTIAINLYRKRKKSSDDKD